MRRGVWAAGALLMGLAICALPPMPGATRRRAYLQDGQQISRAQLELSLTPVAVSPLRGWGQRGDLRVLVRQAAPDQPVPELLILRWQLPEETEPLTMTPEDIPRPPEADPVDRAVVFEPPFPPETPSRLLVALPPESPPLRSDVELRFYPDGLDHYETSGAISTIMHMIVIWVFWFPGMVLACLAQVGMKRPPGRVGPVEAMVALGLAAASMTTGSWLAPPMTLISLAAVVNWSPWVRRKPPAEAPAEL